MRIHFSLWIWNCLRFVKIQKSDIRYVYLRVDTGFGFHPYLRYRVIEGMSVAEYASTERKDSAFICSKVSD